MTGKFILFLAVLAAGCAATPEDDSVLKKNDAIDDYIKVAELTEVDSIRYLGELDHKLVTDKYNILYAGSDAYLVTYFRNCYQLNDQNPRPDIRYENHVLRARSDTYRGCRIASMYVVDPGQVKELIDLGKGPGEQFNLVKGEL